MFLAELLFQYGNEADEYGNAHFGISKSGRSRGNERVRASWASGRSRIAEAVKGERGVKPVDRAASL